MTEFEKTIIEHIMQIKEEIATLKERSKLWGAVAGVLSGAAISYLMEKLK